jgi:hypothetical protein
LVSPIYFNFCFKLRTYKYFQSKHLNIKKNGPS